MAEEPGNNDPGRVGASPDTRNNKPREIDAGSQNSIGMQGDDRMKVKKPYMHLIAIIGAVLAVLLFNMFREKPIKIPSTMPTVRCWSVWPGATVRRRWKKDVSTAIIRRTALCPRTILPTRSAWSAIRSDNGGDRRRSDDRFCPPLQLFPSRRPKMLF